MFYLSWYTKKVIPLFNLISKSVTYLCISRYIVLSIHIAILSSSRLGGRNWSFRTGLRGFDPSISPRYYVCARV